MITIAPQLMRAENTAMTIDQGRHDDKDPRKVAAFVVAFVVVLVIGSML